MGYYAFISYSSKNQSSADALRELLNNKKIDTWMAPGDIPAGSSYMMEINHALKNCSCLVLLLSNAAQESEWVIKEVERAINYHKPIIPVQIEDVLLNDEFEFVLGSYQVVAVRKIDENSSETKNLLSSIKTHVGKAEFEVTDDNINGSIKSFSIQTKKVFEDERIAAIQKSFPRYSDVKLCHSSFFSHVYKALDLENNMDIAIKIYSSYDAFHIPFFYDGELFGDIENLQADNLCPVIDRRLSEPICLIMKYVQGETLETHIKSAWLWNDSVASILKLMLGILNGLKVLHDNNIYYGDLTPKNIIIDANNVPWLCDFSESNYNGSRFIEKTVLIEKYRSPEKEPGRSIDYRSDIYEFGVILSDFLPFIIYDDKIHNIFLEIIRKATKENPDERFQSVSEIIELLNSIDTRNESNNSESNGISDAIKKSFEITLNKMNEAADSYQSEKTVTQKTNKEISENSSKKSPRNGKIYAELSTNISDLLIDGITESDFVIREIVLADNHRHIKLAYLDTIKLNNSEYWVLGLKKDVKHMLFGVFKWIGIDEYPNLAFVSSGKNLKKVYRIFLDKFLENHSGKYVITDYELFQPVIQERKRDKRVFTPNTAKGMFGPYLKETIEIPSKYETIAEHAFFDEAFNNSTRKIKKLIIPSSVKEIEQYAFKDIVADEIIIPDSVARIGYSAFQLSANGLIRCNEKSFAYNYSVSNNLRNSVDIGKEYKIKGVCQFCGGKFSGLFNKKCSICGKEKDY